MEITIVGNQVRITMNAELAEMIESEANKVGMTVEEFLPSGAMEKMAELLQG